MMRWLSAFCLCVLLPHSLWAQTLQYAGVLGNSGISGSTLVRTSLKNKAQDGSGLNSGGFIDNNAHVWLSGGDAINCLDFDGKLIKRYPLEPAGSRIDSSAFAALDGVLYAFGHLPRPDPKINSDMVLFALPLNGGTKAQSVAGFAELVSWRCGELCPTPRTGRLLFAYNIASNSDQRIAIDGIDPKTKSRERIMDLPGQHVTALAIDPDGQSLYVGGYFGLYIGGSLHQPNAYEIVKLSWEGKTIRRIVCAETPAEPTQFRGVVSCAGGAIWDTAYYGFLARLDHDGKSAPGKIASWDMRIPYVSQIVDVRSSMNLLAPRGVAEFLDPLLLVTHTPENAYFAAWNAHLGKLELSQRYGSLPEIETVNLNAQGWVNVGGLWWRFDDAANAAPRFANHTAPCTSGAWRDDWVCGLTLGKRAMPVISRPAFGRSSAEFNQDLPTPFSQVAGFAVARNFDPENSVVFATESEHHAIWRSTMEPRVWAPRKGWKMMSTENIEDPGDIAVLDQATLVVVDGDGIVKLQITGDTLKETARLTHWGQGADQHFGLKLRLSAEGKRILVSDTQRHRVLLIDADAFKPIAQYGTTDQAGAGINQFNTPGSVAISNERIVVADVNNQRILKLTIGQ